MGGDGPGCIGPNGIVLWLFRPSPTNHSLVVPDLLPEEHKLLDASMASKLAVRRLFVQIVLTKRRSHRMRDFVSTNRSPETHTRASLVHLCLKLHEGSCGNREPLTLLVTRNCSKAEETAWNASTSIAAMLEAQLVSDKRSRKISVSHVHSIVRWAFSCGTNGVVHTDMHSQCLPLLTIAWYKAGQTCMFWGAADS